MCPEGHRKRTIVLHSIYCTKVNEIRLLLNYGQISFTGAGQSFAERLLKQFNPTMTTSEAKSKAAKMFSSTKGRRVYTLRRKYMQGFMCEDDENEVRCFYYLRV